MDRGRLVILLVEDDDNDIYFVRRATEAGGHSLFGVHNGEEAILYLKGVDEFANREKFPIPNVVLTDLNSHNLHISSSAAYAQVHLARQLPSLPDTACGG